MKKKKAIATTAIVMTSMLMGGIVQANAEAIAKEIKAKLDPTITINFRDDEKSMKDVSGNEVFPILYEGTTYLPVRAISEMVGLEVEWDNDTRTVYIDRSEKMVLEPDTPQAVTKEDTTGWTRFDSLFNHATMMSDKLTPYYLDLTVDGVDYKFTDGLYFTFMSMSTVNDVILVPVKEYSTVTYTMFSETDVIATICDENRNIIFTEQVAANTLHEITADISGANSIGLYVTGDKPKGKDVLFFDVLVK